MDTNTQIIEFTDADDKFLGRVAIKDGVLSGSSDFTKNLITSWLEIGKKSNEFIGNFADFGNGYYKSELVTE